MTRRDRQSGRGFEITKTKQVVRLASNMIPICKECKKSFGTDDPDLAEQINHYLTHGYVLLYIGPEHHGAMNLTLAMLGK